MSEILIQVIIEAHPIVVYSSTFPNSPSRPRAALALDACAKASCRRQPRAALALAVAQGYGRRRQRRRTRRSRGRLKK